MAESQLGQLLYYLLDSVGQITKILEPTEKECCPSHASLRTRGDQYFRTFRWQISLVVASVVNRQKSLWCVELSVGHKQHITDGGLVTALKAAHAFMSVEYTP